MASAGARAYNEGLGTKPPAGVHRAEPPVGVRGRSLPEAIGFLAFGRPTDATNLHLLQYFRYIGLAGLNNMCYTIILLLSTRASVSWRLGEMGLYARKIDKNAQKYRLGV